jgi:hypothetical protein
MRILEDLIGAIESRKTEILKSLANGNATSFEAYQRLVGQHQGLEEALGILNDLLKEKDDSSN